jgi:regulator of protease activity HflC (stomatin/prohibitin superfamily)
MGKFIAVVLALVLLVVGFIDLVEPNGWGFLGKVSNGHVAVVTRFGKAQDEVLEPGMHIKSYFSTLNPMSTQTQKVQIPLAAFSSDIQQVNAVVTLNYNVDKTNAVTLFREVGKDYVGSLMSPRIQENTKIVFSHYTAENLVQKRDTLSAEILALMQEDLSPYGIYVSAVAIEDIDFTDAFTNAVEAKQVATQEKLTAQTQQERLTMEAEAQAQRATIEATAAAERQKIAAEAEAYAVTVRAEAEAEANAKVAASLTQELIDYTKAQLWNGEMPTVMGDATPILDMTDFAFGE